MARVVSVNVGRPRRAEWQGRTFETSIFKEPVDGPVVVGEVNLDGDAQADRRVHGGPDKAVYAYATEDYAWWSSWLDDTPAPGAFGENLTTEGIDLTHSAIGDVWHVGTARLQVRQPREPCFKLAMRMGDAGFPDRFSDALRPGAYLGILTPGTITAGDEIVVEPATEPTVQVVELLTHSTVDLANRIATDGRVPERWRRAAERARRG